MDNEIPRLLTVAEVGDILHLTRRSLYSWIKDGKLKAAKVGKSWYIPAEELRRLIENGTQPADVNGGATSNN